MLAVPSSEEVATLMPEEVVILQIAAEVTMEVEKEEGSSLSPI